MPTADRVRFVRDLRVKLTAEEHILKGQLLAKSGQDMAALDDKKAEFNRQHTVEVKRLKLVQSKLGHDVDTGTEERPVECEERPDFRNRIVEVVRLDTLDVIETRKMTTAEQQTKLNLVPFPGPGAPPRQRDDDEPDPETQH